MGTRESFLVAIGLQPEDDTHRLVFCDWLEENDEPARAEFIRLQLALAKMDEDDPARPIAQRREAELLAAHRAAWMGELPRWARKESHVVFRRGFVAELSMTEKRFLDNGDELFAAVPVEGVRLRRVGRDLAALSASPHLARLRKLDLTRNVLALPGFLNLATGDAPELRELILDENSVDGEIVRPILESPTLPKLERLSARRALMSDHALRIVAETPGAVRLRALCVRDNRCGDDGLGALARSLHLTNLSELDMGYVQFSSAGLATLADTPLLPRLRKLDLSSNFGLSGAALSIAALPHRLADLSLSHTDAGTAGAVALAESPASIHLRSLNLYCCGVGTAGVVALANSPHLANLRRLDLGHNFLDAAALDALTQSKYLKHVVELRVSYGRNTDAAKARFLERFG